MSSSLRLVLLPGIEGSPVVFKHQRALQAYGTVTAIGLPADPSLRRLDAIAQAVEPALPDGRLFLVGVSMGALVARHLSARMGDRVEGVVGFGALPHSSCLPANIDQQRRLLELLPERLVEAIWAAKIDRNMRAEGITDRDRRELCRDLPSARVMLARLEAVVRMGEIPGAAPLAWASGREDRESPWSDSEARRLLPQTEVHQVAGGHRCHWTHPSDFNGLVLHLWTQLATSIH